MTKEAVNLALAARTVVGKKVKALRRQGLVPVVVHNHGQDSILAEGKYLEVEKAYHKAGKHAPVELTVGKAQHLAMIKDVDLDPRKREVRHIVFQAISQNETVEAEIPLHLVGEIPAERLGLIVLKTLEHVEVEALPRDLPESIEIDATILTEVGDKITVADLKVPAGVTITTDPDQTIVIVEEPRVQEEEAPAEEEGAEGAEGAEGGEAAPADGDTSKDAAPEEPKE